jgi:Na+-transporting methylmalonyl-CoA/oxaloacetate decarboxylase gamma subunit
MDEALTEALELSVVGITIVFSSLILVSLTLMLVNRLTTPRPAAQPEAAAAPAAAEEESPAIPPEVVVVIAAAANAAVGRRVRVRHIRYHGAMPGLEWSQKGRALVMGSHRVRQ